VTLTSLPYTNNRMGPHCSHKSEASLHLRFYKLKLRPCLAADAVTFSYDLTLVTALVTRD